MKYCLYAAYIGWLRKGGGALSVRRAPRVLGINRVMEINVMSRSAGD